MTITKEMYDTASSLASDLGRLNKSITKGDGNVAGIIGELALAEYCGVRLCNTYDYDLIIQGAKFDVKTKRCTSPPQESYDCSVADFNTKQQCDAYFFTRVCEELNSVWLLGWVGKEEFYSNAEFMKKGQIDRSNNFTVKADCYNVKISKLRDFSFLKKL